MFREVVPGPQQFDRSDIWVGTAAIRQHEAFWFELDTHSRKVINVVDVMVVEVSGSPTNFKESQLSKVLNAVKRKKSDQRWVYRCNKNTGSEARRLDITQARQSMRRLVYKQQQ